MVEKPQAQIEADDRMTLSRLESYMAKKYMDMPWKDVPQEIKAVDFALGMIAWYRTRDEEMRAEVARLRQIARDMLVQADVVDAVTKQQPISYRNWYQRKDAPPAETKL